MKDTLTNLFKRLPVLLIVMSVTGIALGVGAFSTVREFVATSTILQFEGVALPSFNPSEPQAEATSQPGETPAPPDTGSVPALQLPEPWDGTSRISLLVIGLDYADWSSERRDDPPRSDTMILFTIDPLSKTAGMLSIPRDMWVDIPGFGYAKINTAYALGEAYKVPGGGAAMAAKTVEQFLGVPIQYYARVDFKAFEEFIDEIGGVIITVEEPITLVPINAPKQTLQPGTYALPGYLALAYARNRKTEGGDIDRANRQQQVVLAIRDRILEPRVLAHVFGNPMAIYREVASGLQTNLTLDDAVRLGILATSIPIESIKRGVIGYDMVTITNSPDGLYVFKPIADKIRILRDEIFTTGGPLGPAAQGATVLDLMKLEGARVTVQNGTYTEGLGTRTAAYLTSQGVNVIGTGNADGYYANTTVIDLTGKPYTLNYLSQIFGLTQPSQFISRTDLNAGSDIILIVGEDWARNNPMP